MKPDAVLINTARGEVVDEAALIVALRDKTIAGAALDVFEAEPLSADSSLISMPNLLLSPQQREQRPSSSPRGAPEYDQKPVPRSGT